MLTRLSEHQRRGNRIGAVQRGLAFEQSAHGVLSRLGEGGGPDGSSETPCAGESAGQFSGCVVAEPRTHGLGVLAVGAVQNPAIRQFLAADADEAARQNIRQIFARLGAGVQCEFDLRQLVEQRDSLAAQRDSLTSQLGMATAEREALEHSIGQQIVELATIQQQREAIALELARHQRKHKKLTGSLSWKLTRPLRSLQMLFRSMRTHKRGSQQPKALSSSPLPPALQPFTSHAAPEPFREPDRSHPNPGAEPRVCCLVHLFYTELWEELAADLRMLDGIAHDVFVNLVEETATDDVKARIRAAIPTARVLVSPNRGRDAGGIISLMALVDVAKIGRAHV